MSEYAHERRQLGSGCRTIGAKTNETLLDVICTPVAALGGLACFRGDEWLIGLSLFPPSTVKP